LWPSAEPPRASLASPDNRRGGAIHRVGGDHGVAQDIIRADGRRVSNSKFGFLSFFPARLGVAGVWMGDRG